jgi:hypothetical protein
VSLVDEQHGERALTGEVFDVFTEGEEDVARARAVRNIERVAHVTVEVAMAEGDVVAIRQSERLVRTERVSQRAQNARLSDAWLARDNSVFALVDTGDELVDEAAFAFRQPELGVIDFLRERLVFKAEVVEVGAHQNTSLSSKTALLPSD